MKTDQEHYDSQRQGGPGQAQHCLTGEPRSEPLDRAALSRIGGQQTRGLTGVIGGEQTGRDHDHRGGCRHDAAGVPQKQRHGAKGTHTLEHQSRTAVVHTFESLKESPNDVGHALDTLGQTNQHYDPRRLRLKAAETYPSRDDGHPQDGPDDTRGEIVPKTILTPCIGHLNVTQLEHGQCHDRGGDR